MFTARPILKFAGRRVAVDAPHLVFATGIAAWSGWFCWDAWRSNPGVENLILIVPVSAAAILLYLFVAAGCFHRVDEAEEPGARPLGSLPDSLPESVPESLPAGEPS